MDLKKQGATKSGSGLDPDSVGSTDLDPDLVRSKCNKKRKNERNSAHYGHKIEFSSV